MRKKSSVGDILFNEFMEPRGITNKQLAEALCVSPAATSRLINNKSELSFDMANRLAKCLGTSVDLWLNLQINYNKSAYGEDLGKVKVL